MSGKQSGKKNIIQKAVRNRRLFSSCKDYSFGQGSRKGRGKKKRASINSSTMNVNTNKDSKRKYWRLFDKSIKAITRMFVVMEKKLCETTFEDWEITQKLIERSRIKML